MAITEAQQTTGDLQVPDWLVRLSVIDVDTHLVEPADLWTSRAPAKYKDRVPQVLDSANGPQWMADGVRLGGVRPGGGVILANGTKTRGVEFFGLAIEDLHRASWDPQMRVALMDQMGIYAQICYPQISGFGNQNFMDVRDAELRRLCTSIYNDAMAEVQETTRGRVVPMAVVPWWDIGDAVAEASRAADLGLRGIVMCSDPHRRGAPDLGEEAWYPFWEVCSERGLSINFHIGASNDTHAWFGEFTWPSTSGDEKLAIGTVQGFLANGRVLTNLIFSGVLDRFPELAVVSVESGIGWLPFLMEAMDHQFHEAHLEASGRVSQESKTLQVFEEVAEVSGLRIPAPPSEYFRRQVYGCFWFETSGPKTLIETIGEDRVLFETDFPHPTCLYPSAQQYIVNTLEHVPDRIRRKVLQDNAASLYRIPLPEKGETA